MMAQPRNSMSGPASILTTPWDLLPSTLADGTRELQSENAPEALLIDSIVQALRATGYPALRQVEVEVHESVIVLWGRVPSYYQKQLAQSTVQNVVGVSPIANGLDVVCSR